MNMQALERSFAKMGARVKFGELNRFSRFEGPTFDVSRDGDGEYFFIRSEPLNQTEVTILDVQPKERHLLLMTRNGHEKHKFLLGHDERHWFVAGIPEAKPVSTVVTAKLALKPDEVVKAEFGLKTSKRDRRKNKARMRQGEWFFVPDPNFIVPQGWKHVALKNEPLVRSRGGKPHMCEELYRSGGETVYVARAYPSGLTEEQYSAFDEKERRKHNWQVMKRNMDVWVRGKISHPDHATVVLKNWCKVYSNTEHLSYAMRNIVFLD